MPAGESTDDDTKVLGIHNTSTHLSHYIQLRTGLQS